ncbi:MAG: tetratricopeptide repeat protein [Candidatus Hydrogenedentota bacterium]
MNGGRDKPDAQPPRSRPRMRWWKKLSYSLLTTLLFFAVLEGGLALVGVQTVVDTSDPFVGFEGSSPLFVTDSDDSRKMVTAPNKLAYFNRQSFSKRKPQGVVRIFCLGGSTTYGRPYDDATSFVGWLRELLPAVAPETTFEVINAGGVSYASYRVARLAEELVQYEPDLFIVYTGQNEFLEERTYRDVVQVSPLLRHIKGTLRRTRTFAMVQRLLGPNDRLKTDRFQMPKEVDAVLNHTIGPTSYERDDKLRRQILDHFAVNLARIVHIARHANAKVIFVTPASNLKDCSPFKSQHTKGLSPERLEKWTHIYEQAKQRERDGDFVGALATFRRAAEIDSRYAELHWWMGRVLLKLKQFDDARNAFHKAIDEDVCPLRAVGEIPPVIRSVAERKNVPLIDFEQLVDQRCRQQLGHASPGEEFFLDHVHPTISANGLLASAIVERLIETETIKANAKPTQKQLDEVSHRINSRIDAHQHAIALRNLAKVLNWAGKHFEAGSLALRAVKELPDDPECLLFSGVFLAKTGRVEQAIENYRRALRHRPNYANAHQMLGAALVDRGKLDEALEHFTALVRLRPNDAHAWQMIGAIHAEKGRFVEALQNYEKAISLKLDDANIHYHLAIALGQLNRPQKSIRHYRRAIKLMPDDVDAHNNLGVMLMHEGRMSEAADHFRSVLRLRPKDKRAADNLRQANSRK